MTKKTQRDKRRLKKTRGFLTSCLQFRSTLFTIWNEVSTERIFLYFKIAFFCLRQGWKVKFFFGNLRSFNCFLEYFSFLFKSLTFSSPVLSHPLLESVFKEISSQNRTVLTLLFHLKIVNTRSTSSHKVLFLAPRHSKHNSKCSFKKGSF